MDYYKNADHFPTKTDRAPEILGVQYHVVEDLGIEPVDVAFCKLNARIDWNTEDALIEQYIKGARQYLEKWSQLSFGAKTMRITAMNLPANWRLMYGPVKEITGYENLGDTMLNPKLSKVSIEYTTEWKDLPMAIKIAICKRAAGDYMIRENYIVNEKGTVQTPTEMYDEAQKLLLPYRNQSFL